MAVDCTDAGITNILFQIETNLEKNSCIFFQEPVISPYEIFNYWKGMPCISDCIAAFQFACFRIGTIIADTDHSLHVSVHRQTEGEK